MENYDFFLHYYNVHILKYSYLLSCSHSPTNYQIQSIESPNTPCGSTWFLPMHVLEKLYMDTFRSWILPTAQKASLVRFFWALNQIQTQSATPQLFFYIDTNYSWAYFWRIDVPKNPSSSLSTTHCFTDLAIRWRWDFALWRSRKPEYPKRRSIGPHFLRPWLAGTGVAPVNQGASKL